MMGGMANLATVYTQLKKANPNTVIVSVGDDLMNKFFRNHSAPQLTHTKYSKKSNKHTHKFLS